MECHEAISFSVLDTEVCAVCLDAFGDHLAGGFVILDLLQAGRSVLK
jgi:hypothetical protein